MKTCETCKWWKPRPKSWPTINYGSLHGACKGAPIKAVSGFYTQCTFGCIHHQPKEADDE